MARGKTPYIYTSFYEGKSCSPFMFVNAWVPEQQVPPIVDYFSKEKGAKAYFLIGSDYALAAECSRSPESTSRRTAERW